MYLIWVFSKIGKDEKRKQKFKFNIREIYNYLLV